MTGSKRTHRHALYITCRSRPVELRNVSAACRRTSSVPTACPCRERGWKGLVVVRNTGLHLAQAARTNGTGGGLAQGRARRGIAASLSKHPPASGKPCGKRAAFSRGHPRKDRAGAAAGTPAAASGRRPRGAAPGTLSPLVCSAPMSGARHPQRGANALLSNLFLREGLWEKNWGKAGQRGGH